jgi:hypothetical protein
MLFFFAIVVPFVLKEITIARPLNDFDHLDNEKHFRNLHFKSMAR